MSKAAATTIADGVTVKGAIKPGYERVLTPEALAFVAEIERKFGARRRELLAARAERQKKFDAG
ncbi:MAG TPA: malate synthase A, partial [Rhodobiaceae bacterium]|nr:malate synthase A [Rhodobiaceae bacterium]